MILKFHAKPLTGGGKPECYRKATPRVKIILGRDRGKNTTDFMLEEPGRPLGSAVVGGGGQTSKEVQLVRGAEKPSYKGGLEVALVASAVAVQVPEARVSWLETVVPLPHAGS